MIRLVPKSNENVLSTTVARVVYRTERGFDPPDRDHVVVEEPLELRVAKVPIAVLMRTPGDDEDLGFGFATSERLFENPDDLARVEHCETEGEGSENVLRLIPRAGANLDLERLRRNFLTSASCGVCGKLTLEAALRIAPPLASNRRLEASFLLRLPARLRAKQPTFGVTGGLHAAALAFGDEDEIVREDIGRHNAVDKAIGAAIRRTLRLPETTLVVSGRCSFEIVQKALFAGIDAIVSVGAASSLAIELAESSNIVLVAFASPEKMSVLTHPERIDG